MSRITASVDVSAGGSLGTGASSNLDTLLGTVAGADTTAVEAAVAVLEGDGASPTQGHVNSLRTVWNTLKADAAGANAAQGALGGVAISVDTTKVRSHGNAVRAINAAKTAVLQRATFATD